MKRSAGLASWLSYSSFLLGTVAAGASSVPACSSDANGGGGAGATAAGSAGAGATGGAGANAGAAGTVAHGGSSGAGGSAAGGANAGASGSSTTEQELAVSLYACKPDCPTQQYCALLGPACTTEPCVVRAVCRDRPACGTNLACPVEPDNMCRDDPSDSCTPGATTNCPGRCFCTEAIHSCGAQVLDRRPSICSCVTPGPTTDCLDVTCPGDETCEIVLGKAYCISP